MGDEAADERARAPDGATRNGAPVANAETGFSVTDEVREAARSLSVVVRAVTDDAAFGGEPLDFLAVLERVANHDDHGTPALGADAAAAR